MSDHLVKEEDVFFMDVERWIQLIVNDDDDEQASRDRYTRRLVKKETLNPLPLEQKSFFCWGHDGFEQFFTPKQQRIGVWLPREKSNGTGVFIPNHHYASTATSNEQGSAHLGYQPLQERRPHGRVSKP